MIPINWMKKGSVKANQIQISGDNSYNIQTSKLVINKTIYRSEPQEIFGGYSSDKEYMKNVFIKDIVKLNPNPGFYFWRSEGKSGELKDALNTIYLYLKKHKSKYLINMYYYYGLYFLQEGLYIKSIKYFKIFLKNTEEKLSIYWICLIHLGKAYFYIGKYKNAYDIWQYAKLHSQSLSNELANYNLASIAWREYLMKYSQNFTISNKMTMKNLLQVTDKSGNSQIKNFWFSLAYSEFFQGQVEESLDSITTLKSKLKKNFKQPMFMIATLLLEARALSLLGFSEKENSLLILESLGNLRINWDSQLFLNNLCKNMTYGELYSSLKNNLKSSSTQYLLEEADKYRKHSEDIKYIYKYLSIDKLKC